MAGQRLKISAADRDERLGRYAELRDQGMLRADAAREVGVSYSGAGAVYERWYLSDRGLPPRRSPCLRAGPWFA
jgi:hypothetical protein